jgi:pteridine reductase
MDLRGRAALVTGGARRVGRAIALALAEAGADVVVHYRSSRAAAEATCATIRAAGVRAVPVEGDFSAPGAAERLAREALGVFGRLDVLVNNAAVFPRTPLEALSETEWEHALTVNLKVPFHLATQLGRAMPDGGVIVNIGDWAAARPYRHYLAYCVSKAGVVAMTKGLAKALAPKVRVNCVAPGPVLPPDSSPPAERQALEARTLLRRLGSPEAVARMVRFLAMDAEFSTGGVYLVDGGRSNA